MRVIIFDLFDSQSSKKNSSTVVRGSNPKTTRVRTYFRSHTAIVKAKPAKTPKKYVNKKGDAY